MDQATHPRLQRARYLIDLQRWAEATTELRAVLAADPESVTALCLLAQCQLGREDPEAACTTAERAMHADPDGEWPHRIRSVALGLLGRHHDAVAEARECVRLDPDTVSYLRLARALLQAGELDEAREAADRALELDPELPKAHRVAGDVAEEQGDPTAARAAYQRALELDPQDAEALADLARLDNERLRLGAAFRHNLSSLAIDPHDPTVRDNLDIMAANMMMLHVVFFALAAPVLMLLAIAELVSLLDVSWPRGLLALGCVVGWTVVVGRWLRQLPTHVRRHLRGIGRRFDRHDRARFWWLAVPTLPLFLGTALLPAGLAWATGAGIVTLFLAGRSGRIPGMRRD